VQWFDYPSGFLYLTAIACFFALLMPETRQAAETDH